jgi:hypothetical protein
LAPSERDNANERGAIIQDHCGAAFQVAHKIVNLFDQTLLADVEMLCIKETVFCVQDGAPLMDSTHPCLVTLAAALHWLQHTDLHLSAIYPSLEAYIDETRAALAAGVRAYQAEVATAEAAHCKRRREALKAERAAEPPAPALAQPARAYKRARGSASNC